LGENKDCSLLLDGKSRMVNNNVGKAEELNNCFWSVFEEEPYTNIIRWWWNTFHYNRHWGGC